MIDQAVRAGTLEELRRDGRLLTKVGTVPVVVFWHDDAPYAIEDRCPHLGFPLHQGTVEAGLVTCHWHHARFDLVSGCTLDMWADDARGCATVTCSSRPAPTTTRSATCRRVCATVSRRGSRWLLPSRCSACSTRASA